MKDYNKLPRFVMEYIHFSGTDSFCAQIRWNQAKPASVANLILLKFKEVIQLYS